MLICGCVVYLFVIYFVIVLLELTQVNQYSRTFLRLCDFYFMPYFILFSQSSVFMAIERHNNILIKKKYSQTLMAQLKSMLLFTYICII